MAAVSAVVPPDTGASLDTANTGISLVPMSAVTLTLTTCKKCFDSLCVPKTFGNLRTLTSTVAVNPRPTSNSLASIRTCPAARSAAGAVTHPGHGHRYVCSGKGDSIEMSLVEIDKVANGRE